MEKKLNLSVEITYDYISFDGSNYDDVKDFVKRYRIYGNSTIEESFHIRPADIPNFDTDELLEWWESTGEIKEDTRDCGRRTYNTHNYNNMPLWRKDEMLMIECKGDYDGYVQRKWLGIGDTIVVIGGKFHFIKTSDTDDIEVFVKEIYYR